MTVEGHTIKCDAHGCRTTSFLDSAAVVSPEYLRVRFAGRGWTEAGDEGELDLCPKHS